MGSFYIGGLVFAAVLDVPLLVVALVLASPRHGSVVVIDGPWLSSWGEHLIVLVIEVSLVVVAGLWSQSEGVAGSLIDADVNDVTWVVGVVNGTVSLIPEPLLVLVVGDVMLDSKNWLTAIFDSRKHEVHIATAIAHVGSEIEALIRLHCGGVWLDEHFWVLAVGQLVAFQNIEIEGDILMVWDGVASESRHDMSSSQNQVAWALHHDLISAVELWKGYVPASESVVIANSDLLWIAPVLFSRVHHSPAIVECSLKVDGGPVTWLAEPSLALTNHID